MSISVNNLTFSYGRHEVLHDVSFDMPDGALVNVLGPNGVGKSTLFRCILCLEQGYEGSIRVDGLDLRGVGVRERAQHVSYIPQAHSSVYDYSVLDVVTMSTAAEVGVLSSPTKEHTERAWQALERIGIAHLANRPATQISGGEQQLVLIARALAQNARTIVMDEPTSALDYGNTVRVLSCVRELAREGYSILQSTHQPDQAFLFADKVLVLADGRVRAYGDPKEVVTESLVADIYGVDVRICSLYDDRVRVCVPVAEIDLSGEKPAAAPRADEKERKEQNA